MGKLDGKKVLFVIASHDFRDEEYVEPRAILEKEGAKVAVACSKLDPAKGMLGKVVKPDLLLKDAKPADYDAVVFVGGMGSTEYWNDPVAHKLAREISEKGKVTSAICLAPVTLANAGLLKGRPATVWSSAVGDLKKQGAKVQSKGVVADGKLVTADGPQSAKEFGQALVTALTQ